LAEMTGCFMYNTKADVEASKNAKTRSKKYICCHCQTE